MDLIIALIVGISILIIGFILINDEPSPMMKRLKRKYKKEQKKQSILEILISKLRPVSEKNLKNENIISKSKKLLLQAGYASDKEDVISYESKKIAYLIIGVIFAFLLAMNSEDYKGLIAAVVVVFLAYRLPEMQLQTVIKKRKKEFMKYIPDAVDLLAICVQAGLGIDAAFSKVAEEFKLTSETISVEFDRLNKDILSGLNREEAYKNLVARNENPDLQSFVALLIQTDKLGTSISSSLEAFCDSLRTKKRQRIEELSQQASTKMTIPMVLCLLPAIFIIIMYPAMRQIMTNLG